MPTTHATARSKTLSTGRRLLSLPAREIVDVGERRKSQLVAILAAVLFVLTTFAMTWLALANADELSVRLTVLVPLLASFAVIFLLNRAGHLRLAAFLLCLGPLWSNVSVGMSTPGDPIWYAYMPAGVLLASVLLSFREAVVIGSLGALATGAVALRHSELFGRERGVLIVTFVVTFTAIIVAAARFAAWVEEGRRAELRELERRLAASQRMESLGRLAAGVAHDFNNYLTAIQANADLARDAPKPQRFDEIDRAVGRATDLVSQLLTFARPKSPRSEAVQLDGTIRNLQPILERLLEQGIQLSFALECQWSVDLDAVQLEQIVLNLCTNARDALPDGGRIEIATRHETISASNQRSMTPGEYVCLTVKDDGAGMEAATLERVFEPFFTTKALGKGSGLGLATVQSVVAQSRGYVDAHSAKGLGTTMRVLLPRGGSQTSADPAIAMQRSSPTSR